MHPGRAARGIEDVSAIVGVPGPFYVTAWHPLNPDVLPAIAELAESQKQRFVEAVQELQRPSRLLSELKDVGRARPSWT